MRTKSEGHVSLESKLTPSDYEHMEWMLSFLSLPDGGVERAFPTINDCATRFASVRWPGGVLCPKCKSSDVGFLELRKLYHCRNCRRQFSATSGTAAHRSRLDLRLWFKAAEDIITAYAQGYAEAYLTGHGLADRYGISYAAAYRMKQILLKDLANPMGLFRPSICVRDVVVPPDIADSNFHCFSWLVSQVMKTARYL